MFTILGRNIFANRNISMIPRINNEKNFSKHIKFTKSEEWLYYHRDYTKMGITKKAVEEMTELVYLEFFCKKGDIVKKDEELFNLESVKTSESINAPYDCVVLGINTSLTEPDINLENINKNSECTENSWIVKIDKIP